MAATARSLCDSREIICVHCKKKVIEYVQCCKCNEVFHPACMNQAAQKKNPTCKHELQVNEVLTSKTVEVLLAENELLRELVRELQSKNQVLEENSQLLKEKIDFLYEKARKSSNEKTEAKNSGKFQFVNNGPAPKRQATRNTNMAEATASKPDVRFQKPNLEGERETGETGTNKQTIIHPNQVKLAIHQAQTMAKINELQDLTGNSESNEEGWQVQRQRRQRNHFLIGRNKCASTGISSVPKPTTLHVTRLHPGTKSVELEGLLRNEFPEVKCEQLNSKHPEAYSSFKVTINHSNFKAAWSQEIWPEGARVSKFFSKRGLPLERGKVMAPTQ